MLSFDKRWNLKFVIIYDKFETREKTLIFFIAQSLGSQIILTPILKGLLTSDL